jgi:hypothetical protein
MGLQLNSGKVCQVRECQVGFLSGRTALPEVEFQLQSNAIDLDVSGLPAP